MSMRDISEKQITQRTATARAIVRARESTIDMIRQGKTPKGDPLPVAKIAAVYAAKNTGQLIPYCHPLPIDFADCRFAVGKDSIEITTEVKATYKTGVEMEALTAASVAALTIYDMLKMVDTSIEIESISLLKKTGGKSDYHKTGH
jgi:cyclic pyranopterin phosphate synthase